MTARTYAFTIKGLSPNNQTWETRGKVHCEFPDTFDVVEQALGRWLVV